MYKQTCRKSNTSLRPLHFSGMFYVRLDYQTWYLQNNKNEEYIFLGRYDIILNAVSNNINFQYIWEKHFSSILKLQYYIFFITEEEKRAECFRISKILKTKIQNYIMASFDSKLYYTGWETWATHYLKWFKKKDVKFSIFSNLKSQPQFPYSYERCINMMHVYKIQNLAEVLYIYIDLFKLS